MVGGYDELILRYSNMNRLIWAAYPIRKDNKMEPNVKEILLNAASENLQPEKSEMARNANVTIQGFLDTAENAGLLTVQKRDQIDSAIYSFAIAFLDQGLDVGFELGRRVVLDLTRSN